MRNYNIPYSRRNVCCVGMVGLGCGEAVGGRTVVGGSLRYARDCHGTRTEVGLLTVAVSVGEQTHTSVAAHHDTPPPLVRRHPSSRAHTLFRADCDGLGRAGGEGSNGAVHHFLSGGEVEGDTEGLLDRGRTMSSSGLSSSGLDSIRRAAVADAVLVDFDGRPGGISNR